MTDSAKVIRLEPESQRQKNRARLARLPAVIHALNELGQTFLAAALERYFDAVDDALFDLADKALSNHEQNVFFESMREVRLQRKGLEKRILSNVEEAFAGLSDYDAVPAKTETVEISADALSLIQNDDLEQIVALESTSSRATRDHAATLQAIAHALSRILPHEVSDVQLPLGPTVICQAFMQQIKRLEINIKAKLVLFKLFDRHVISSQKELNQQVMNCLEEHGIRVNLIRRNVSPSEQSSPVADAALAPDKREAYTDELETSSVVAENKPAYEDEESHSRQDLMSLLSFIQRLPVTADSAAGMDFERLLASVQNRRGQVLSLGRLEKETMGLVQTLFQFVLQDQAIADPFRELIGRMQIPILKLALSDGHFLQDKRHPARRLLNELTETASSWQKNEPIVGDEPAFVFMRGLVDRVLLQFDGNPDVFNDVLADFTAFMEKEKRRAAILERRILDAEDGKARAEEARQRVAEAIEKQTSAYEPPKLVEAFIKGPWSNVMFITGLKFGFESEAWNEQVGVLEELIWSIQPCENKADRQKLIRMIPGLVQRLRRGLDSISYNPFEVAELFSGLEEIHLARIRGESVNGDRSPKKEKEIREKPQVHAAVEALEEKQLKVEAAEQAEAQLPDDDPHMVMASNMVQGTWFETKESENRDPVRCRLAAYIRPTGKYIFVNRNGAKVMEKTREELARALKSGKMRAIDHSMLFDKALESVVTGLRQAKAKSPLDLHEKGKVDKHNG